MTEQNTFAIAELQQKANDGDAQAQFDLALCYANATGIEKNEELAFNWHKKAAEQGFAEAQFNLALCYFEGRGVEQNEGLELEYLKKAAEQNLAAAQYVLAHCYLKSRGVEQNDGLALEYFKKAAEQGSAKAQLNLAICYFEGRGVEQNDGLALECLKKAAEQGLAKAQLYLARCYFEGRGVEQNDGLALECLKKAAEQGFAKAQIGLALCYLLGKGVEQNEELAFNWHKKAAEQGFAEAQFYLAHCYLKGQGVEHNEGLALEYFKKAAEQGSAEAQNYLAQCYLKDQGVEHNEGLALEYFKKAAEQGFAGANLAHVYLAGKCVDQNTELAAKNWIANQQFIIGDSFLVSSEKSGKNDKQAFEWFTSAAELGSADAYVNLYKLYNSGRGIEQSDELAFVCVKKAVEQYKNVEGESCKKLIANRLLADCYAQGKGVEKSEALATQIYQRNTPDLRREANLERLSRTSRSPLLAGQAKKSMSRTLSLYFSNNDFDLAEEFVEKAFENAKGAESYKDICLIAIKQAKELEEKNQELEEKNKQLKLEIQRKESLQIRMQKLVEQFTHSLGNVIFPDTIYQVAERLKNNPECRKDVLLLHEAYHSEIIIKLQGDLLRQRHANTDPGEFRQFIRSSRRTPNHADNTKSIEDILDYAASRVTARFLNQHYAGLTSIRDKILSKKNVSLDSLKQKFEDDILLNKSLCPIAWINQNLRPVQITEISPLWKKVFILSESHAEALLFGHFSEILFNAFKYADHDKDEFLTLVFDEKTINNKTYLSCSWLNPVKDKSPSLLGTGEGLDAIQEDLKQLNDTENPEESLLISQQKKQFQVTLFFKRDLLYKESTSEEDLNLFL